MEENTLNRIKQYIDYKGVKVSSLEKGAGMSNGSFASQLKNNKTIGVDKLENILKLFPQINTEWLLTGKGSMEKAITDNSIELIPIKSSRVKKIDNQEVPLYDIYATASVQSIFSESAKLVPLEYIRIPNLPKCDGAIPITGDSMYPLLKSGDIVLYKEGHDKDFILWGEMYLVYIEKDGEEYFAVKYLQKSNKEGYIKLVSYNDHHQPKEFPIDCLKNWALVKASIRINSAV